jgi:hypothetical protein
MTHAVTKPSKGKVKRAIEGTLKDNEKLYELLEKYDEKAKAKTSGNPHRTTNF